MRRVPVLLAYLAACAPAPDVGIGIAVSPEGVSPSVSVAGGGVSLGASGGTVTAGVRAGILGLSVSN